MRVEFSAGARADLKEIARYIARDDPAAAKAWVHRLMERAKKAGTCPRAARMVPEIKDPDVREVLLRTYRIIYRIEEHWIVVLTVFEGHRKLRRL